MTNAERIRQATDFELAALVAGYICKMCSHISGNGTCPDPDRDCAQDILEWLQKTANNRPPVRNYDRIKDMNVEQLRDWIVNTDRCACCVYDGDVCLEGNGDCNLGVEKWLLNKVKEN